MTSFAGKRKPTAMTTATTTAATAATKATTGDDGDDSGDGGDGGDSGADGAVDGGSRLPRRRYAAAIPPPHSRLATA